MSDIIKVGVVGAGGNTVLKHIPLLQKLMVLKLFL